MGKEDHRLQDYTDFFGLDFFTIYNFGEVVNGTYFNP
jgi:hypothetical protein